MLGVRQDSRAYVRRRHPGRRAFWLAADLMQAAFRALARRCPIAVVGADLAEQFPDARELQPFHVSLVGEADVRSEDPPERATFARRILTVGRLDAEKNPLLLVDAMARLAADGDLHPPWRLDVYGEGPLEPRLVRRIEELGSAGRDHAARLRRDRCRASRCLRARRRLSARLVDGRDAPGADRGVRGAAADGGHRRRRSRCAGRRRGAPRCSRRCTGCRRCAAKTG